MKMIKMMRKRTNHQNIFKLVLRFVFCSMVAVLIFGCRNSLIYLSVYVFVSLLVVVCVLLWLCVAVVVCVFLPPWLKPDGVYTRLGLSDNRPRPGKGLAQGPGEAQPYIGCCPGSTSLAQEPGEAWHKPPRSWWPPVEW